MLHPTVIIIPIKIIMIITKNDFISAKNSRLHNPVGRTMVNHSKISHFRHNIMLNRYYLTHI